MVGEQKSSAICGEIARGAVQASIYIRNRRRFFWPVRQVQREHVFPNRCALDFSEQT